jgi:hypothetical protein
MTHQKNSSLKIRERKLNQGLEETASTLDALLEFIMKDLNNGDLLYLAGDFNARTASTNFEFEDGEADPLRDKASHPNDQTRSGKHNIMSSQGRLFLDNLACADLSLLNGCALGDVIGEYTSVNYNGSSVVDYVATMQSFRALVKSFRVLDLTKYSDHKACVTTFAVNHEFTAAEAILDSLENAQHKYKWPSDSMIDMKFMLSLNSPEFRNKVRSLAHSNCKTKMKCCR